MVCFVWFDGRTHIRSVSSIYASRYIVHSSARYDLLTSVIRYGGQGICFANMHIDQRWIGSIASAYPIIMVVGHDALI